jgi:hypothetical protein
MTRRSLELLVLFILLLLLARHVWVAAYIHPYADDLTYAVTGRESGLLERLCLEFNHWNGRYFSNILVLRGPMIQGMERGLPLYRLIPVVLLLLCISAAYMALRAAFPNTLTRMLSLLCALAFAVLFVHLMPHAGEGLYWYTGAVTYLLPNIFMLLNVSVLLRCRDSGNNMSRWLLVAASAILIAAIVGSNEVSMVHVLIVQSAALILGRNSGMRNVLIGLLIWALLCSCLVYFAPGNAVREAHFINTREPFRTLVYSGAQTIRFTGLWLLSPVFLLASILVIQWGRGLPQNDPFRIFLHHTSRWLAMTLPLVAVFVAMALPYWGTGILGQHRTVNAALFMFLPLVWLTLLVWDAQVFQRLGRSLVPQNRPLRIVALVIVAFALLFLRQDGAVTADLWSGTLSHYDAQCTERYAQVQDAIHSGADTLELDLFHDPPRSLKVLDLSADPSHFMNRGLVLYFGGEELLIRPRE